MGTTAHQAKTRSVFIADDDGDLRMLLKLLIQAEPGLSVSGEACTGRQAMDELLEGDTPPDILLVDVNMPLMDVAGDLQRLRVMHPLMEVVVHSGEDEADGRRRIGDIGEYAYVVKGRPDRLLDVLRRSR